ncbi:MAG: imidazole glycerol phosphate synthase subunit HisH [Nitrospinae bacterium]|nr:imidazole glycerol phosphate synthase subunit HisH [Nitrospinota bacterium]
MPAVIVDYDVGNLRSVQKAVEKTGARTLVSSNPADVLSAEALILPGVGAFGECMANLGKYGLLNPVREYLRSGKPFLGICVGYQLLFEESDEFGPITGLNVFPGKCVRFSFPKESRAKIPHMGWNQARITKKSRLFEGIADGTDFYFVHSYFPIPGADIVCATTEYAGQTFASAVENGNIFATQFHPEKSQRAGLAVLANFARVAGLV